MKKSLVLGFFDGVHIAHQAVINTALEFSDDTVLITFKESPAKYFNRAYEYILPREESVNKIKSLGVNEVIELDFSKIASLTAEEYLNFLTEKFSPASISTGFNHTFGKNKSGNSEFLEQNQKKYGYKYFCTPALEFNGEVVSSTFIKKLLREGKIEEADFLLNSSFLLEGTVIKGAQLGRTIGFPTANIKYPENIVKIPYGVYSAKIDNRHALLNWGMKPTVHNTVEPVVEAHILDFSGDLYGKKIKIEVLKKIRDEIKFPSLEELKLQIEKDIISCSK